MNYKSSSYINHMNIENCLVDLFERYGYISYIDNTIYDIIIEKSEIKYNIELKISNNTFRFDKSIMKFLDIQKEKKRLNNFILIIIGYMDKSTKCEIETLYNIRIFDINVILSNILDNALNALNKVTQPVLYIYIKYDRGILCIDIKNNCINSNYSENTKNKIDPFGKHGYGLNNVRRVVKKYHGNLAISCLDGFFTTRIILYIED